VWSNFAFHDVEIHIRHRIDNGDEKYFRGEKYEIPYTFCIFCWKHSYIRIYYNFSRLFHYYFFSIYFLRIVYIYFHCFRYFLGYFISCPFLFVNPFLYILATHAATYILVRVINSVLRLSISVPLASVPRASNGSACNIRVYGT